MIWNNTLQYMDIQQILFPSCFFYVYLKKVFLV